MSANGRLYVGQELGEKEADKILKKVATSKILDRREPIKAMLGRIFLGSVFAFICTDTGVVYYNYSGGLKLEASIYPYDSITSISIRSAIGILELLLGIKGTAGVKISVPIDSDSVSRMVDLVRKEIVQIGAEPVKVSAMSPTDELKKYFELKEQGIITQEEFEAKKKQLLEI